MEGIHLYLCVFSVLLSVCLVNARPQIYNSYYWRTQPRSINEGYYNQRYYNHYSGPRAQEPIVINSFGYYRPTIEQRSYDLNENGGEVAIQGRMVPANNDTAPAFKKEATRILHSPSRRQNHDQEADIMLGDQNTDFVFPGYDVKPKAEPSTTEIPYKRVSNQFLPDMKSILSGSDKDATFLTSVDHYPSEHVEALLRNSVSTFGGLLGTDELANNVSIATRIDVTMDGTPLCRAKEHVVEPKVARNADDQWKFIVNEGPYIQGIRVEICEKAGDACEMSENFPLTYVTECKQKYIYRKLLSVGSTGEVEPDNFRLPSCCTCVYRQQNPMTRFGGSGFSPRKPSKK